MELSLSQTQSDDDDDVAPPSRGQSSHPNSPLFGDTESNIAEGGQLTSPPRSPSNILVLPSPTGSTHQNVPEEDISNFIKYGCIRPPKTVLQDEFMTQYRHWKEHDDVLYKGLDKLTSKDQNSEAWAGYMTSIRNLHSRDLSDTELPAPNFFPQSQDVGLPRGEDQPGHQEEKVSEVGEFDDEPSTEEKERRDLERLAAALFRPGSRLFGNLAGTSPYEVIVIEGDIEDELGQQRGILARHRAFGDIQCVYLQVSIVGPTEEHHPKVEEEGEEEGDSSEGQNLALSLQCEYTDGDSSYTCQWNRQKVCFEGTFERTSEATNESNHMSRIISGIISGHSDEHEGGSAAIPISRPALSHIPGRTGANKFELSPCTHLHPRGLSTPLQYQALQIAMMALSAGDDEVASRCRKIIQETKEDVTPDVLLEEVYTDDNAMVASHRARTDRMRLLALRRLCALPSDDFAILARKRHKARRREKWRRRIKRVTPQIPLRKKTNDYDLEKKKPEFYDQIASISWTELLEEAVIQTEKTCSNFRRQSLLLENLTFESVEYKAQVMTDLRRNGLTLAASHAQWDNCIQLGRTVALGWSWLERGSWTCLSRSAIVGKRCVMLLFQIHSRLDTNHKRLEKAFRSCDSRLTKTLLDKIESGEFSKHTHGCGEKEGAEMCGICQCNMDEPEGEVCSPPAVLPCGHAFHWECVREWLHSHSECPICRASVSEQI